MSVISDIESLLSDGLGEINFSDYPFGKVADVLEKRGFQLSESKSCYEDLCDWINGWELDYLAYILDASDNYTGFYLEGSFLYGTCYMIKENV